MYLFAFSFMSFFTLLIKESQQPEGYLIVLADFRVVAGVNRIGRVLYFIMYVGITDAELQFSVYQEVGLTSTLVHLVVLPKRVYEEGLHSCLLLYVNGVDGIQEVGVVEHHL